MGTTLATPLFFSIILPSLFILILLYGHLPKLVIAFKRLKWLFLSIFILNLWFTTPNWLPDLTQISTAFQHLLPLVTLLLGVHLLLIKLSPNFLIAVMQWWLTPLSSLSFPVNKFSVRIVLILEVIDIMQNAYVNFPKDTHLSLQQRAIKRIIYLFTFTYQHAQQAALKTLVITKLESPPLWQWCFPILFCILIILTSF